MMTQLLKREIGALFVELRKGDTNARITEQQVREYCMEWYAFSRKITNYYGDLCTEFVSVLIVRRKFPVSFQVPLLKSEILGFCWCKLHVEQYSQTTLQTGQVLAKFHISLHQNHCPGCFLVICNICGIVNLLQMSTGFFIIIGGKYLFWDNISLCARFLKNGSENADLP